MGKNIFYATSIIDHEPYNSQFGERPSDNLTKFICFLLKGLMFLFQNQINQHGACKGLLFLTVLNFNWYDQVCTGAKSEQQSKLAARKVCYESCWFFFNLIHPVYIIDVFQVEDFEVNYN